jgi:hypothetical protein
MMMKMKKLLLLGALLLSSSAFTQHLYRQIAVNLNSYGDSISVENKSGNVMQIEFSCNDPLTKASYQIESSKNLMLPTPTVDGDYRIRAKSIAYGRDRDGFTKMSQVFYFFDVIILTENGIRSVTIR